jgi:hypothetical protein
MSARPQAKLRVEQYAQSTVASLAKGKPPRLSSGLHAYVDKFPDEVLITLEGFVQHLAIGTPDDFAP